MIRLVRPNLGNPLILEPSELQEFEITVAYKKDWINGKEEREEDVPKLSEEGIQEILKNYPPKIGYGDLWIPLSIGKVHFGGWYAKFEDNYCDVIHPVTNSQLHYASGYRWEARVKVGITDAQIQRLKDSSRPRLLNLQWKFPEYTPNPYTVTNYHAIYVHETLKRSADFTILHITDTHIAKRNDLIPEILCRVRNKKECHDLKNRYVNFNDHLRAFIKEANQRVKDEEGKVIVVLTGDIIDYYFDGYWDGEWVCGQGGQWPDRRDKVAESPWDSNLRKFHEIITGRDRKGEALSCPIFTIPGNHEYYANEIPMSSRVGVSFLCWEKSEEYGEYNAFNLTKNEGRNYDFWMYRDGGKAPSISALKSFKVIQETPEKDLSPAPMLPMPPATAQNVEMYMLKHWQIDFTENVGDKTFWLIKPKPLAFSQYLSEINYDVDFEINIGNSHLLFWNTGHDRYPTKWESAQAQADYAKDFLKGGPHSRGVSPYHLWMLNRALDQSGDKLIFIFTHAPLLCLDNAPDEGIEKIYEENLKNGYTQQLEALKWLSDKLELSEDGLKESGYVVPGSDLFSIGNFKQGGRGSFFNFYSMEGCDEYGSIQEKDDFDKKFAPKNVRDFMYLISRNRRESTNKPVLLLSGHTHKIHEFRIERQDQTGRNYYYYCDNYSGKYFQKTDKGLSLLLRFGWLQAMSPLLLTSGGLKNKEKYLKYREIIIRGTSLASLEMKSIANIEKTGNFTPGCKLIALRAHNGQYVCAEEGGKRELVANSNKIGPWEAFEMIELEDGKVAFKACNGKFVRAEGGGGGKLRSDISWIKDHETFLLLLEGENKIALRTHNGKYVCAEGGGGRELVANRDEAREWETFELIEI